MVYRATWTTQRVATGVACGHLKVHCTLCRTNAGKRNGNKWPQMIIKHAKSKKKKRQEKQTTLKPQHDYVVLVVAFTLVVVVVTSYLEVVVQLTTR